MKIKYKVLDLIEFKLKPRLRIIGKLFTASSDEIFYMMELDYFDHIARQCRYEGKIETYQSMHSFSKFVPVDPEFCAAEVKHLTGLMEADRRKYFESKGVKV